MPRKITFDDIVLNKIKDYIGTRRWSVSQFAARYTQTFAELYGKMEAPSTSTARKLVEEKGHIYTEREAIVIEQLSGIAFHKMWLEEQQRLILRKMDDYVLAHGDEPAEMSHEAVTEVQVADQIRRFTKYSDSLSAHDVSICLRRYAEADTRLPLVVLCDSGAFASYLVETCIENATGVAPDAIATDGADLPNRVVYAVLRASAMSREAGRCVNDALRVIREAAAIGRDKHIIVIIESWDADSTARAMHELRSAVLALEFHWTYKMLQGWLRMEEEAGYMNAALKKFVDQRFPEVKTLRLPDGGMAHQPAFEHLYDLYSVTRRVAGADNAALLRELIDADCLTYGFADYLIEKLYATKGKDEVRAISRKLQQEAASRRAEFPAGTRRSITRCLDLVDSWPDVFKAEVRSWMEQGGSPVMPDADSAEEWMEFLMDQYERQREWLDDDAYLPALDNLKTEGFPMHWFSDSCDQKSLLTAMITFPRWKASSAHAGNLELPQLQLLLLSGDVPSLDAEGWTRWFERTYHRNLVAFNFDLALQIRQLRLRMGRVL